MVLIADPGMAAAGVWDELLADLLGLGIRPEDVTHVFISHHHPDHVTKLGLFPDATVVDFWGTYEDDLWSDHPDDFELAPESGWYARPDIQMKMRRCWWQTRTGSTP